jgi:preprotein translocase subunit YajC
MFNTLLILAQEGKQPQGPLGGMEFPLLMVAIFFLFWMFVLRPMGRRQQQERDAMISNLTKNDKVLTNSGIYGTVISVSDKEDEIVVKVDDNTRLKMIKGSIARNLTKEEAARAAKDKPKEGAA